RGAQKIYSSDKQRPTLFCRGDMQLSLATRLLYVFSVVSTALSNPTGEHQCRLPTTKTSLFPLLDDISIENLHTLFDNGSLTSVNLVHAYIERITEINPSLRAVGEINPDALDIARALDAERYMGRVRGPLHGIPILIKACDNIATKDQMNNTAGSYALVGAKVSRESSVVTRLRDAGAIMLGKATMGEWAQCRSRKASSSHGWSAYGGQVLGAYYPQQDPSGSSSGSAVAVSIGLAVGSIGTETSGSIVNPAERSNVVGIKPTLGLTSRDMTIPISLRQDTLGPIGRTVKDAAYMLTAIAGKDTFDNWTSTQPYDVTPDYVKACNYLGLKGARVGIPRNGIDYYTDDSTKPVMAAFEKAVQTVRDAGARVIEEANFSSFDPPSFARNSSIVLDTDFVSGLADYLSSLSANPNQIHSLHDIAHFTKAHSGEEFPDRDTYVWDRQLGRNLTSSSAESWAAYQANLLMGGENGVVGALDRHKLDALIMPTFSSFHLPAIAGLPVVTVPLGFYPAQTPLKKNLKRTMVSVAPNIPFGISFVGRRWSEEKLISLAYAFEQRTMIRRKMKPYVRPTFELSDQLEPTEETPFKLKVQYRPPVFDNGQRLFGSELDLLGPLVFSDLTVGDFVNVLSRSYERGVGALKGFRGAGNGFARSHDRGWLFVRFIQRSFDDTHSRFD
ncbi:MAG: hypothetical protein Q9174_004835, partial [Haloplaca sp. 1 TL-2023]